MMRALLFLLLLQSCLLSAQYKVSTVDIGYEVSALANAADGRLIYGTSNGVIGYFDGLKPTADYHVDGQVNALSTTAGQLYCSSDQGLQVFGPSQKNFTGNHLEVLTVLGSYDLLACRQGIYGKEGSAYTESTIDGLPKFNAIYTADYTQIGKSSFLQVNDQLYEKRQWWQLASDSIIDIAHNGKELVFLKRDGIYSAAGEVIHYVSCDSTAKIFLSVQGRLFLTNDNFISELKEDVLRPIYTINTEDVLCIAEDQWDNIWISANDHLYRVSLEESTTVPTLSILAINDSEPVQKLVISEKNPTLNVRYQGIQLTKPQLLSYQSKLEGFTDWLPQTNEQSVRFDDLRPGTYSYQVRATVDGTYYKYSDPIEVQVSDGLFGKIFLLLLLLGLGILITALIGNYRLTRYKNKIATERKKLLDQNKLLSLEQKALQLQMNPHFIFNALNSIKGLIAKGDSKQARESLTAFAHLMRSTLDMSRSEVCTIEEEKFYLHQYLDLEKWVMQEQFDFSISIVDGTDPSLKLPTMIIQPFVENAVKHAFRGKEERGQISVRFEQNRGNLVVSIEDDGVGIDQSATDADHKSVAMSVVRDRLALKYPRASHQLVQIVSPVSASGGTLITINIPILAS